MNVSPFKCAPVTVSIRGYEYIFIYSLPLQIKIVFILSFIHVIQVFQSNLSKIKTETKIYESLPKQADH